MRKSRHPGAGTDYYNSMLLLDVDVYIAGIRTRKFIVGIGVVIDAVGNHHRSRFVMLVEKPPDTGDSQRDIADQRLCDNGEVHAQQHALNAHC